MTSPSRWIRSMWLLLLISGIIVALGKAESSVSDRGKASVLPDGVRRLDDTNTTSTGDTSKVKATATNGTEDTTGNGGGSGGSSSAGGDAGNTEPPNDPGTTPVPVTPVPVPTADGCSEAKSCRDCMDASEKLADKDTHVCVYELGSAGDSLVCQKRNRGDAGNPQGDNCSGTETIPEPEETDDSNSAVKIAGIVVVVIGFCLYAKSKLSGRANIATSNGSGGKAAKYHEVAVEEEDGDEEWGWGDENGGESGGLEMAGRDGMEEMPAYRDDKNVKRRTSGDSPFYVPSPTSSPPQSTSIQHKSLGSGLAPKISPAPQPLPAPKSLSTSIPTTSSGSHSSTPVAMPDPIPQRITSLGKKTPPKPKPAPKKEEDDIFASMGFSAKPTFAAGSSASTSHRATSAIPSAPTSSGSGRWGQTSNTAATGGMLAGASAVAAPSLGTSGSMDDGDDNWDDDPLDDLLDD